MVQGSGSGSLDAFVSACAEMLDEDLRVLDYHEHSKGTGVDATAVAYIEMQIVGA